MIPAPGHDNDPDSANWRKPIMGANDGASGVAVMLEIARLLRSSAEKPGQGDLGVDFVCFDAEDWGTPSWSDTPDDGNSWALGAQYWSKNLPQGYEARYGILLDMVGGQGARFYQEGMSLQYAPEIVKKVWRAARQVDCGSYFPPRGGRHGDGRPYSRQRERQDTHHRHRALLSRLPAEFLWPHVAHGQ